MKTESLTRQFIYNGAALADPDPTMSPGEVRDFYSTVYPEIVSAEIEGPDMTANTMKFTFRRAVGTKGARPPAHTLVEVFSRQRASREMVVAHIQSLVAKRSEITPDATGTHSLVASLGVRRSTQGVLPSSNLIPLLP